MKMKLSYNHHSNHKMFSINGVICPILEQKYLLEFLNCKLISTFYNHLIQLKILILIKFHIIICIYDYSCPILDQLIFTYIHHNINIMFSINDFLNPILVLKDLKEFIKSIRLSMNYILQSLIILNFLYILICKDDFLHPKVKLMMFPYNQRNNLKILILHLILHIMIYINDFLHPKLIILMFSYINHNMNIKFNINDFLHPILELKDQKEFIKNIQ